MKALVLNGKVVELAETEFEVHSDLVWVEATDDAEVGGTWDGTSFGPLDTRTDEQKTADRWKAVRHQRNRLLKDTDWWTVADRTMTDEERAYRQALRDLPANTADPANPTWPTKP